MDKPQECYIAFLDIMGFAGFVTNETPEIVQEYLTNFITIANGLNKSGFAYDIKIFSDCIVISTPIQDKMIDFHEFLLYINWLLLANIVESSLGRLPLRGAITRGSYYTDEKDLTFGKALVKAHEIESQLACYPRIIVNPNDLQPEVVRQSTERVHYAFLQAGLNKKAEGGLKPFNEYTHSVRRDFDGLLHCNYLSCLQNYDGSWIDDFEMYILKHKEFTVKNLEKSSSHKHSTKYNWIKTYHNWFCSGFRNLHDYSIISKITT